MPYLYCISGLGTDYRIFERLKTFLPDDWEVKTLDFIEPEGVYEDFQHYVERWLQQADIKEPCYILGLSLGGMLATELCRVLDYKTFFLVSSLRYKDEIPWLFKIARRVPLYRLVPAWWTRFAWGRLTKLVGMTGTEGQKVVRAMIHDRTALHLNWGRRTAVHWEPRYMPERVVRMHGTKDHIFRYVKVKKVDYKIDGGTHAMIFDRAEEIAAIILKTTNHTSNS